MTLWSRVCSAHGYNINVMAETYRQLVQQADIKLAEDGIASSRRRFERGADLRYAQQGVELTIKLATDSVSDETISALVEAFHHRHEELCTFSDKAADVEIVNLRVEAIGEIDQVQPPTIEHATTGAAPRADSVRRAALDCRQMQEVPVFRREALLAGHVIVGPAIVDQLDSTISLLEGQRARVDDYANLIIEEAVS